jgi:hypothetical protein
MVSKKDETETSTPAIAFDAGRIGGGPVIPGCLSLRG